MLQIIITVQLCLTVAHLRCIRDQREVLLGVTALREYWNIKVCYRFQTSLFSTITYEHTMKTIMVTFPLIYHICPYLVLCIKLSTVSTQCYSFTIYIQCIILCLKTCDFPWEINSTSFCPYPSIQILICFFINPYIHSKQCFFLCRQNFSALKYRVTRFITNSITRWWGKQQF